MGKSKSVSYADVEQQGSSSNGHGKAHTARAIDTSCRHTPYVIDTSTRYLVTNRTPYAIVVDGDATEGPTPKHEFVLPPFAARVVCGTRLKPFEHHLRAHRQRHEVRVRPYSDRRHSAQWVIRAMWVALAALLVVIIVDLLSKGSLHQAEFYAASAVAAAVIVAGLIAAAVLEHSRRKHETSADVVEGDIAYGVGGAYVTGNETFRRASQLFTLIVVVAAGAVFPAVAIIVATDTKDFLSLEGGWRIVPGTESRFIARLIQITYTAVLSLFPALLYFQFDRHRVGTIRGQWVRSIFRMDGRMRTMADVHSYYGDELTEASNNSSDSVRFLGGRHSPIIVATILIALGWTILVVRTESFDFAAATDVSRQVQLADAAEELTADALSGDSTVTDAVASEAAGTATEARARASEIVAESTGGTADATDTTLPATTNTEDLAEQASAAAAATRADQREVQSTSYFQVLAPSPSAAAMAFLGAYFFGVYLLLRSYFRGDLRPKIYNQITARLVTVVVLAYVINAMFAGTFDEPRLIWAMSFLAGVIPTTMLRRILLFAGSITKLPGLRRLFEGAVSEAFSQPRPLTQIDGVDLYDANRLEAEGVPDVPALADSRLVSVMVNTRLPLGRLVDWADQAALMVVLSPSKDQAEHLDPRIASLRAEGIRTATDFLKEWEDGKEGRREIIEQCLASTSGDEPAGQPLVPAPLVCSAVRRQRVMADVIQWRESPLAKVDGPWIELPEPSYRTLETAAR